MIRFGLIGCGLWGSHHAKAIAGTPDAELAFIVGSSPDGPAELCRDVHAPYFTSLDAALAAQSVDVIDIAAPNHLHAAFAQAAFAKGCHVLLEKPMATSVTDARAVVEAWKTSGRVLYVGFELRLSALWNAVRDRVRDGEIGQLQWIDIALERHPFRPGRGSWRFDDVKVGNWLIEEAVHHLDLIAWIGGTYAEACTLTAHFPGGAGPKAELCAASATFAGGLYATYRASLNAEGHHLVATFYGSKGSLRAEWHGVTDRTWTPTVRITLRKDGQEIEWPAPSASGELFELQEELRLMTACAAGTAKPAIEPWEAVRNLEIALALQTSGESGSPASLDAPTRSEQP